METTLTKKIEKFIRKNRMYNAYSSSRNIVEKTWNNGHGSLALFRFYESENIVLINTNLANKPDRKKLAEFLEENGMKNWEIREKSYGYPNYYFESFKL